MQTIRSIRVPIAGMMIILVAALFAREFIRRQLMMDGYAYYFAKDLSYFVVPPLLLILLWPILRQHKAHLQHIFRLEALTVRIVLLGICTAVLLRLMRWGYLGITVSLGLNREADHSSTVRPEIYFGCPEPLYILTGLLVLSVLTPIVEEFFNRGFIVSGLVHIGKWKAILLSAVLFTIAHVFESYEIIFLAGVIFAMQYWNTGALWLGIVTHAVYNALVQLDSHCATIHWDPPAEALPLPIPAIAGGLVSLLSLAAAVWLSSEKFLERK